MNLPDGTTACVCYTALLQHAGCTGYSHETAVLWGGNDVAVNAAGVRTDFNRPGEIFGKQLPEIAKKTGMGDRHGVAGDRERDPVRGVERRSHLRLRPPRPGLTGSPAAPPTVHVHVLRGQRLARANRGACAYGVMSAQTAKAMPSWMVVPVSLLANATAHPSPPEVGSEA
jgi:hypothetical protein